MFNLSDTIAAICTPVGTGSIAAIRISGPESWEIVKQIFDTAIRRYGESENRPTAGSPAEGEARQRQPVRRFDQFEHMRAIHGFIKDSEKTIDEVILLPYKSPNSFTTEDTIEIFCHGGNQISSMILDLCLKNGVRLAKGGEFTFRAFVNGRIDLTEAEAINEIIHAESEKAVYSATNVLLGSIKEKVNIFRERLFNLITLLESSIEFPMDVPEVQKNEIAVTLDQIALELNDLIEGSKEGQILRNGIKVSIIGETNVGKSSLLNRLLENQRAIVTEEAGTTRDTIEEKIVLDGYPVVLIDTAGIRRTKELKESEVIGIERSKNALKNSDLALLVFDLTKKNNGLNEILNLVNGKPNITVGNKIDLVENDTANRRYGDTANQQYGDNCDVSISAKFGTNIDKLKRLIIEKINSLIPISNFQFPISNFYINQRQKELLLQAFSHVNFALETIRKNEPEDLISDELKKAVSKFDEVSGRKISDDVILNIFAKFCIGK